MKLQFVSSPSFIKPRRTVYIRSSSRDTINAIESLTAQPPSRPATPEPIQPPKQPLELKFVEDYEEPYNDQIMTTEQAMAFDGPIPEMVNGRLTMFGFVAGVAAELCSGQTLIQQFEEAFLPIILFSIIIIFASLYPILYGADYDSVSVGPFNKKAEYLNGRASMVGFATMLIIETLKHHSLFPKIF